MNYNDVLESFGDLVVSSAQDNLSYYDKINTGTLYDSISYYLHNDKLSFIMSDYGVNDEYGRSPGSYVPVDALETWMRQKGISLEYSYVINRSIKENGIRPTYFFQKAVDENIDNIDQILLDSIDFMI